MLGCTSYALPTQPCSLTVPAMQLPSPAAPSGLLQGCEAVLCFRLKRSQGKASERNTPPVLAPPPSPAAQLPFPGAHSGPQ